ncbi:PA14 domain-containing protein (plasmid) [Bacillus cereus]|nr:PA14 domain-containing protein [Bacillus cereus]
MKKKPFLFASCLLSLGIYFSFAESSKAEVISKGHIVSKDEAYQKANSYIKGISKQAYPNWKDAQTGTSNTLYDLDGNIAGYVFQIEKNNEEHGYIIVDKQKNVNSIVESSREGSNPYKNVEEGKAIYTGPLQHLKKENDKIIDLHTNQVVDVKKEKYEETKKPKEVQSYSYSAPKVEKASVEPETKDKYIKDVPDYQWYRGCSPTAIANLVTYWSQYYNNLLRDNETPHQLINNLGDMMGTDKNKGQTQQSKMAPGIQQYWKSRGYNVETQYDTQPTYDKLKKEIDSDRPIIVNIINDLLFGDHTVTGVGYLEAYIPELNETYKDITVHDTWDSTPVDVTLSYDQIAKNITSYITVNPSKIDPKLFNFKEKTTNAHYNWGGNGPLKNITDNFSATFDQKPDRADEYFIQTLADDSVRVDVNGKRVIDRWSGSTKQIDRAILPKDIQSIKTEYYEKTGDAAVYSDVVRFGNWVAYYYPNKTLKGFPVDAKEVYGISLSSIQNLKENFGIGSLTEKITSNGFSARYSTFKRLKAGEYLIKGLANDGIRVLIDGKVVLDRWKEGPYKEETRKVMIKDGTGSSVLGSSVEKDIHLIEVQYFNVSYESKLELEMIPYDTYYETDHKQFYQAEYYDNAKLNGNAALEKIDKIDFNWKNSSPHPSIKSDNFSARFKLNSPGLMRNGFNLFEVKAKGAVRVYNKDKLIIDLWNSNDGKLHSVEVYDIFPDITIEYLKKEDDANLQFSRKEIGDEYSFAKWFQKDGKWYYRDKEGHLVKGLQTIEKYKYYFNEDGVMLTGLQTIRGEVFYFNENGTMTNGWKELDNKWYYFDIYGTMHKGWEMLGDKWYYFNKDGVMLTGSQTIDGKVYYFNADGARAKGWKELDGKKYYFNTDGTRAKGWKELDGKKYYFNKDGVMLTGSQTIDGKVYYFNADGTQKVGKS